MEKVIGSLKKVSGHTYDTIYELIFTTERVIAFLIQSPANTLSRIGVLEISILGSWHSRHAEQLEKKRIAEERARILRERPLDELVKSNIPRFEIPYNEVNSVEVSRGLFRSCLKFYVSAPSTADYSVQFTLEKKQVPDAWHLLNLVLPSKIKKKQ
jgi:hypothetical protein